MTKHGICVADLLLAEYERLKDEQRARTGFRDNLLYVTLAAMAAAIVTAIQAQGRTNLLLLLPPVSVLLGWTYLVNDQKISAAGRYIRDQLRPALMEMTDGSLPIFGWEVAHRHDLRRTSRKWLQLAVDLSTFCLAPFVALTVFWVNGPLTLPFAGISFVELVSIGVLAQQIVVYADISDS